jgi:hypothetical protein
MVTKQKKGPSMSSMQPTFQAIEEVRQANRLFLEFLRSRPALATEHFHLSRAVADALLAASQIEIDRAASFPRALFRLQLPRMAPGAVLDAHELAAAPDRRVLQIALLQSAWTLCRTSGYSARLLLRLDDDAIARFRHAELRDVLLMSLANDVLHAAFDELDWIWRELLTETRPELRRRLLLLGLQPDLSLVPASVR